jgi:hypothetical protein
MKAEKQFFFEKKNQKTFVFIEKVFCFFFSKKKYFLAWVTP